MKFKEKSEKVYFSDEYSSNAFNHECTKLRKGDVSRQSLSGRQNKGKIPCGNHMLLGAVTKNLLVKFFEK